jgi:hypothetical protein
VEVPPCSRSWRRAYLLRKAPGTPDGQPVQASAIVIPVAVAHVAVVCVTATHGHIVAARAHGTMFGADARKVSGAVKGRDRTDDRGRASVLPAVTGLTSMRMAPAVALEKRGRSRTYVAAVTNQRLARRRPSRIASSSGLSRSAR